jgi:hypothetical protein
MIGGWLYLLQKSDCRKKHKDIYEIERTNDFNRRINEYTYDTQIISVIPVNNDKKCERELIKEFKSEFDWRKDVGNEHFEDNERHMISVFNDYWRNQLTNKEENIDMGLSLANRRF